jgi:hypothetical protein
MRDQKLKWVPSADVYAGMDARNGLPNTLPQAYSSGSEVRCCCDVCRPQMLQCYMDEAVTGKLTV